MYPVGVSEITDANENVYMDRQLITTSTYESGITTLLSTHNDNIFYIVLEVNQGMKATLHDLKFTTC